MALSFHQEQHVPDEVTKSRARSASDWRQTIKSFVISGNNRISLKRERPISTGWRLGGQVHCRRLMAQPLRLTAIIEQEDEGFVSLCPELDIASQGSSMEEARANLVEALSLFFETADPSEIARRYRSGIFVTQVEAPVG